MKLDFEPNLSSDYSAESAVSDGNFTVDSNSVSEMLQEGIKAAQEGSRSEARVLLLQVAQIEPENENAWLWLASISEYPEELLGFLNNVLNLNPENERALEWARATNSLLAKTFVQRGIDAARDDLNGFAKQCFLQAIAHEKENEAAWLWLASVSESVEEKNAYLEKVLLLNPENETALSSLETVKKQMNESHLPKAVAEAVAGETEAAVETLEEILAESPEMEDAWLLKSFLVTSFDQKLVCYDKVLEFNPASELARGNAAFLHSMKSKLIVEETETPEEYENSAQIYEVTEFESDEFSPESADDTVSADLADKNQVNEFAEHQEVSVENKLPAAENLPAEQVSEDNSWARKLEFERNLAQETLNDFVAETENNVAEKEESGGEPVEYFQAENEFKPVEAEENVFENFDTSTETRENDSEEMNFAAQTGEAEENVEEVENYFAVPELETATGAEIEDEIAKIYAEYSVEEPDNSVDQEVEEIPSAEDALPSYYEAEDESFSLNQPVESDYPQNTEGTVQNLPAEHYEQEEEISVTQPDEREVEVSSKQSPEMVACPFCKAENEAQAFVCQSCKAVLSLSDLEMLFSRKDGDNETVSGAVEMMEAEKESFEIGADEMKFLGIGQINLKNFRQGLNYLQEAVRMNPNDVVLSSQVNALAIRLADIEQKESVHNLMPKNKTILVVDDSATVRKLISGKLEKCGHTVLNAVDGMDALEKINEAVPDLILLDINMPRMDGYQVCKLIRGNDVTKDVPIVMISGKDGFFDKVRGRMAGTTGYITKPFGPETLMKTVETYIVCNSHIGNGGEPPTFDE